MNISDVKGKKVKILTAYSEKALEEKINEFLRESDRPIWNIQFHSCANSNYVDYSVLIIYG